MSSKSVGVLYHNVQSRSHRTAWLLYELQELGLAKDIEVKLIDYPGQKTPEFLKINPHGKVPVYVEGDNIILESAAISLYFCHKYNFLPKNIAKLYMWVIYSVASRMYKSFVTDYLVDAVLDLIMQEKMKNEPNKELIEAKTKECKKLLKYVQDQLGDDEFLVDNTFSAADTILAGDLYIAEMFGVLKDFPKLQKYYKNLEKRPANRKAFGK